MPTTGTLHVTKSTRRLGNHIFLSVKTYMDHAAQCSLAVLVAILVIYLLSVIRRLHRTVLTLTETAKQQHDGLRRMKRLLAHLPPGVIGQTMLDHTDLFYDNSTTLLPESRGRRGDTS
jgi:hypothetical protein